MKNQKLKSIIGALAVATIMTASVAQTIAYAQQAPSAGYSNAIKQCQAYLDEDHLNEYVTLIDSVRNNVTPTAFAKTYLPIKIAASKAIIDIRAHGMLSSVTHAALEKLASSIGDAGDALNDMLSIPVDYNSAMDLLTLQEILKQQLSN